MLGIISAAGNALRSFGSVHPAIRWGVIVLAGLLAVEVVAKEAVSVWVAIQTAPAQVEQQNAAAREKAAQAAAAAGRTIPLPNGSAATDSKPGCSLVERYRGNCSP
jgi:hypothetical protein